MSGPKVITIVSLEEIVEICQVLLAQVGAEIAEWTRIGYRNSVISKADETAIEQNRGSLIRMLELGQHLSLQKEAPLLIQKLRSDMDERLERAEDSRAGTARVLRSLQFTAAAVLRQAKSAGIELPLDVTKTLHDASQGRCDDIVVMEKATARGIELTRPKQTLSSGLSAASQQLAANAKSDSLDDWIRKNLDQQQADKRLSTADKFIAQIGVLDEQFSGEQFKIRLQELASNEDSANRSLMLDTVCLELKAILTKATQWAAVRRRFGELRVEADVSGELDQLQLLFEQMTDCQQRNDITAANFLTERIQEALNTAKVRKSGEKKRQAIIQGLSEIGYAVNSEMAKVWTSQKQLVVRSPDNPSIGIELGGNLEAGRCQVRVVALEGTAASRDLKTDREIEEHWCSDLSKLQEKLATAGASLRIEKATAAGVVPLKVAKGLWSADFAECVAESEPIRVEQKRAK
jgi:hypothetical protein